MKSPKNENEYRPAEAILSDPSNPFAHYTVKVRLPAIIDRVIEDNPDIGAHSVKALKKLRQDLLNNMPMRMFAPPAPDYEQWSSYFKDHEQRLGHSATWQHAEWFFLEHFFFRSILSAVDYWKTGLDPFRSAKTRELNALQHKKQIDTILSSRSNPLHIDVLADDFTHRLSFGLWGNQIDLSHDESQAHAAERQTTLLTANNLIVDDTASICRLALQASKPIHIVCDNAGTELTADLCIADWFIKNRSIKVYLHVKEQPTYVSDATENDVEDLIKMLGSTAGPRARLEFADRLIEAKESGNLMVKPEIFWNSPLFFNSLPERIQQAFSDAGIIFIKGDMNYRRLLSDRIVPAADPLSHWAAHLPAPAVILRTMKSDPVAGVSSVRLDSLEKEHPDWRTSGRHGLIQLL
ncbi:MAG: ARMT1-like domain-containing protein [Spirochaetales bacterium]|uniref:ARMT1-like domain-containing protein n=1 Tax=Candidatus Thalassospirochaeta sargassi TaxID=3119039 RepID=A0AAJ1IIQ5_9SPIO|nr:ARMT1-like domain-containing protein [Spirochaetales bacterium]